MTIREWFTLAAALTIFGPRTAGAQANLAFCNTNANPCSFVVYQPGAIVNAKKGAILVHAAGGPVGALLGALGQKYTHSGMITSGDGTQVTHNSANVDMNFTNLSEAQNTIPLTVDTGINPSYGDIWIDPMWLWNADPGAHTTWVTNEGPYPGSTFQSVPGASMYWSTTDWAILNPLGDVSAGVTAMRAAQKHYRLHAYMDQAGEWTRGTSTDPIGGGHCSGTVYQSLGLSQTQTYSSTQVQSAAGVLFSYVENGVFQALVKDPRSDTIWVSASMQHSMASGVADQVVNCFYWGDTLWPGHGCTPASREIPEYWRQQYWHNLWANATEEAHAVSPDDMVTNGFAAGASYPYALANGQNTLLSTPILSSSEFKSVTVTGGQASHWISAAPVPGAPLQLSLTFQNDSARMWGDPQSQGFFVVRRVNSAAETQFGVSVPDNGAYVRISEKVGYGLRATVTWTAPSPLPASQTFQVAWCDAGVCWPVGTPSPAIVSPSVIMSIVQSLLD